MPIPDGLRRSFSALGIPNFRIWFVAQGVSVTGNWMQTTALGWLVVQLTGDGFALGVVMALQYLPLLLFGPLGGSLVDRFDVRRSVMASQASMGVLALVLWILTAFVTPSMLAIYAIALGLGVCGLVDNPARRAFISEIVPQDRIGSAVSLGGVMVNSARVIGPAMAAGIIAVAGVAPAFLLNAFSFAFVVLAMLRMRRSDLIPREERAPGPIRITDTLRYVAVAPSLRRPLMAMTLIGTFVFEFSVVLPLLATFTFGGDGTTYGIFLSVMSVGAVLGSFAAGAIADATGRWLEVTALLVGITMLAGAAAPTMALELVALFFIGMASFAFAAVASTAVQVNATSEHRGRVLALWSMAFLGTTMVGAPLVGWIASVWGPRAGLFVGAVSAFVAGALVIVDRTATARPAQGSTGPLGGDPLQTPSGSR